MQKNNSAWTCSVTNCYSTGAVTAQGEDADAGGVLGTNDSCTVENCYYDSEKCTLAKAVGNADDTDTVKGLTTAQMTGESALESMTFSYDEGVTSPWLTKENTGDYLFYPHLSGFAYDSSSTDANWPAKIEYTAPVPPTGIELDQTNITLEKGATENLTATILPDGATGTITWKSDDPGKVSVDNGTVTAVDSGTATVTASIEGTDFSADCFVTVVDCLHRNKSHVDEKEAKCTEDGNNEYYVCDDCGTCFKADGVTPTTVEAETISALGHNWSSEYHANDNQHWRICTRCNDNERGTNHTFGGVKYTWAQDNSTCTAEHTCSVCGREVRETVDATSFISKDPTCTEAGETTFEALFTKTGFTTQTKYETIPSPGHDWGRPTYTWDEDNNYATCTAKRECTRNGCEEEETETVNSSYTVTATCVEAGMIFYTASFTNAAFEAQEKEVAVDALGHNWQEVIICEATADSLGVIQDECKRCFETGDQWYYLLDETSPSEYPNGEYISDNTVQAKATATLDNSDINVIVQDPLETLPNNYEIIIKSISADLGNDYDGTPQPENAYKANVVVKLDGEEISGQLPGKVRLLLEIPDGWDINDVKAFLINIGQDDGFTECIEYQVYDGNGNYIKTVDKDYQPEDGETVKVFAAIWTDHFSPYALVDAYTDRDALEDYKADAKEAIENYKDSEDYRPAEQTELQNAVNEGIQAIENAEDTDGVDTALANAKAAIDEIKTDEQLTAEELEAAKAAAKEELRNYKDSADYRPAEQTELQNAVNDGIQAIENAEDTDGVDTALENAKAVIDGIKTDAEYAAEELEANKEAFEEYKEDAKAEIDALAQEGDSDETKAILENAKNEIDAKEYNENQSLEENEAALDAIVENAGTAAEEQREAEQLEADKEAFEEYKEEKKAEIDALAQEDDSDETKALIDEAKKDIDDLEYDENKSLEENKTAADAIVDDAEEAVEKQREAEKLEPAIWIDDFEENTEIGYKEDMIFRASTADMPEGAEIHWFVNGEDVGTGEGLGVEEPTEDYTVQAKMLDKDGNVIAESGTMNVKVRNGFFDRLLAFFASLFDMIFGGFLSDLFGRIC